MLNVIIPTLGKPQLQGAIASLRHLPMKHRIIAVSEGKSWPEAVNIGLSMIADDGDVLLMDDDVTLTEDTFNGFSDLYQHADVFGFKLLFPDGTIQHAGGFYNNGVVSHILFKHPDCEIPPYYACHCTASLLYIKREVIDTLGPFQVHTGEQYEDVEFSWRALKRHFRIMFTPGMAWHKESGTKGDKPDFKEKQAVNFEWLLDKHVTNNPNFARYLESFPHEI